VFAANAEEIPLPSMVQTKTPNWGKRIQRAIDLAEKHSGSAEVLSFYRRIIEFQKTLYDEISARPAPVLNIARPFREQLDVDLAAKHLPGLLTLVQRSGPSKLAQEAAKAGAAAPEQRRRLLDDFLSATDGLDVGPDSFFARVLFQPLAESLAAAQAIQLAGFSGSVCPVCGARPQVAVLHPEGDGGKRFLVCSFCVTEWEFRRILCPVCGEEDYQKLPRYSADDLAAARIEACDTCKRYLKSVDMTVDGLAVPLVDEIATAPLDLWAAEQGYTKIRLNLMGF
jgi:FdhE protein